MVFHLLFLLFNLRARRRVKLFCLGGSTLVLLHIVAVILAWQFSMAFEAGTAPGVLGALGTAAWLFLPLLYLLLLPLVCVPPKSPAKPQEPVPAERTV